ncbi:MAG: hypothetical protein ABR607_05875 [Pyrinomonadaceae bacterium]
MKRAAKVFSRYGFVAITLVCALISSSAPAAAAAWNGIEPLKTRRDEVIKILGPPVGESPDGVMRFNVMGGSVQVSFVNDKFVTAKKLRPEIVGTVLEIVLHHEHSSDTPQTLKLLNNHGFTRDETRNSLIFRNIKEGILYTFVEGVLTSTRYTFADDQLAKARRY